MSSLLEQTGGLRDGLSPWTFGRDADPADCTPARVRVSFPKTNRALPLNILVNVLNCVGAVAVVVTLKGAQRLTSGKQLPDPDVSH
jgi:hypothetical protein